MDSFVSGTAFRGSGEFLKPVIEWLIHDTVFSRIPEAFRAAIPGRRVLVLMLISGGCTMQKQQETKPIYVTVAQADSST